MTIQFSADVRNALLDAIETAIGTAPTLELRTGTKPANCAAADSGSVIATMTLPSDWKAAAASGSKAKSGTWQDPSADAGGTIGHYRIKQGGTCHEQGSVTITGSGGDMTVDNPVVEAGQQITITSHTWTAGNA